YAGIQYLHRRAGASPVSAKLLMESILFLANFAVQRLIIFRPTLGSNGRESRGSNVGQAVGPAKPGNTGADPLVSGRPAGRLLITALITVLFAVLAGIEIYGFTTTPLFAQIIWYPVG